MDAVSTVVSGLTQRASHNQSNVRMSAVRMLMVLGEATQVSDWHVRATWQVQHRQMCVMGLDLDWLASETSLED